MMKNCTGCKFAKWQTTKAGKLHPSGDGRCEYKWVCPPLPAAMHWFRHITPLPSGGHINRREDHKHHCPCYQRGDK